MKLKATAFVIAEQFSRGKRSIITKE